MRVRPPIVPDYAPLKGEYFVYAKNSGSIQASNTGSILIPFNHTGYVVAISGNALLGTLGTSNANPLIGCRDAFTIQFQRQNGTTLVTEETLGTTLFGLYDWGIWLVRPWSVQRAETIQVNLTNKISGSAITVYVGLHFIGC